MATLVGDVEPAASLKDGEELGKVDPEFGPWEEGLASDASWPDLPPGRDDIPVVPVLLWFGPVPACSVNFSVQVTSEAQYNAQVLSGANQMSNTVWTRTRGHLELGGNTVSQPYNLRVAGTATW